jgi:predicted methyltransferase
MGFLSVLSMAHRLIAERLQPGDAAVDATVGGGVDTVFLARAVGRKGKVFGFDIQKTALEAADLKLHEQLEEAAMPQFELLLVSHERMREHIPQQLHGKLGAVMFNLGYYPGDENARHIVTETASTLRALEEALALLRPKGILTVVVYPGHEGGADEAAAAYDWASALSPSIGQTIVYRMAQKPTAPYLIAVERQAQPGTAIRSTYKEE